MASTIDELQTQVETLSAEVEQLQNIAGEAEYELRVSGEELDEICDKVKAINYTATQINSTCSKVLALTVSASKINTAVNGYKKILAGTATFTGSSTGTSFLVSDVMTGFTSPVVLLNVLNNPGLSFNWSKNGQNNTGMAVTVLPGVGSMSNKTTYTLTYLIVEGS